ncbi:TetR/AcrR family transcriptional regulator [Amycolatopsis regifaucium]|uniref:Transcriptional regulator n=1 Tax=Amycolatopsis regifaucium TaxID=546365 RepID=A0A154MV32_9PSEU|nr:TetR/AcrR family transcriptional regulator [Amycolatopsis regifaucium]KZB88132.1 transcriptional regulator [Amycolatopsis regifaucium]OKA04367.1 TetR family transcriptional regulator [Amycolatopsis regifaucium]SFH47511.1 DNA-binding transcriptional regulator, AcrR family [Amycolatopsis regifaucium]
MARPKEFDERTAIGRAMDAFWLRGYEGTSTQALCAATGLGRSSIYNTFTSKHELFMRALDHYAERGIASRTALLEEAEPGIGRFRALFAYTIDEEVATHGRGCLVVNTVAEFGDRDTEVKARIDADTKRHLALLTSAALEGQHDGTVDRARKPADIAEFAHSTVAGLRLMSRRGSGRAAMEAVANIALDAIAAK